LMSGISIKTADNETLRYYIYKAVTIEGAAATTVEAAPAVENKTLEATAAEAAPVVEKKTAEAATEPVKAEERAILSHDIPGSMYVHRSYPVTVYITKNFKDRIIEMVKWQREPSITEIAVGRKMQVTLKGDNFEIEAIGCNTQLLTSNAIWEWNVVPTRVGEMTLIITPNIIDANGDVQNEESQKIPVKVEVSTGSILEWIQDDWQLLAGFLGSSILALAAFFKWLYPLLKSYLGKK